LVLEEFSEVFFASSWCKLLRISPDIVIEDLALEGQRDLDSKLSH
jgi:hypothetical protein